MNYIIKVVQNLTVATTEKWSCNKNIRLLNIRLSNIRLYQISGYQISGYQISNIRLSNIRLSNIRLSRYLVGPGWQVLEYDS